jgi:hypothetical protein
MASRCVGSLGTRYLVLIDQPFTRASLMVLDKVTRSQRRPILRLVPLHPWTCVVLEPDLMMQIVHALRTRAATLWSGVMSFAHLQWCA